MHTFRQQMKTVGDIQFNDKLQRAYNYGILYVTIFMLWEYVGRCCRSKTDEKPDL